MQQITWTGRPVYEKTGNFEEIRWHTPTFDRKGFRVHNQENEHLDMIIKMPINAFDTPIPVATVSKRYSLVQHHDVIDAIERALNTMDYPRENIETRLQLTIYGERMWLTMKLKKVLSFDPGDGHSLTPVLHVLNSVDGSTSLIFKMGWFRLICENELMRLEKGPAAVRKRHTPSLESKKLGVYLEDSIKEIIDEGEIYRTWHKIQIDRDSHLLKEWIDSTVAKEWGLWCAARCYHIITTGTDGEVDLGEANTREKRKHPHTISVSSEQRVPGAKPVENVYDVVNALSWISSHHNALKARYDYMKEVPELLADLNQRLDTN